MIHILYRSIDGRPEDCLGAVEDPAVLFELQTTDAMPFGGYLKEVSDHVVDANTGDVIANVEGKFVRVAHFDRTAWEAKQAVWDTVISGLDPSLRAERFSDHVSEIERKAQRAAERAAERAARKA